MSRILPLVQEAKGHGPELPENFNCATRRPRVRRLGGSLGRETSLAVSTFSAVVKLLSAWRSHHVTFP